MLCTACEAENESGRKFCGECGAPLAAVCPSCGAGNSPGVKFCGDCGSALSAEQVAPRAAPAAERRLVSVLFADLVGFTAASESRDAEETRELLSRYFGTCKRLISLYGGTVEKFIGDAVMAVWGTPTATEDDAERAVRAALDLVAAVPALDYTLKARAGVLTGEAAVTVGAEGQGMVAGDLVNTASRVQSTAEPGSVLVGETTKRASEAAVAYENAGLHELKGKTEPVPLWRALRVVAARGGEGRTTGLEAPFVGREGELRLVKDLFHAAAEDSKAHLVSVVGVAGIGKSRLAWEFEKYIDGLVDEVWWHRGRCLAYGEGVAYWAIAEMVRMRAGIAEEEPPDAALQKLSDAVALQIADSEEREWIEPRLAHLLGLADRIAPDREDLFSAWRLFFERMAEQGPAILVFEDLQWADAGLLDFIEYLLDWSRTHPLFLLTLARPEFGEQRPTWGAGKRSFHSLFLEPLPAPAMHELLAGLAPGLPDELGARVLEHAEGIPLYGVETVRMLLDRGLVVREPDGYRLSGPVVTLDVPETLHALIAARLDGLTAEERRLLQDASVLGKTFTKRGLAALSGLGEPDLDPLLSSLIAKEILTLQADPRSPERGQYGFLQDLVKRVAYETLSKRERKRRHLAAASFLEQGSGSDEEEIVAVVAAHLLNAYAAAPDADDAPAIKAKAREHLARAGERAASLAATTEAQRYFEHAAELADDPLGRGELLERAGITARQGGQLEPAVSLFGEAIALFEAEGATHPAARVAARLAETDWNRGKIEDAVDRMERAFQALEGDEPDADLAMLAAQLGRLLVFAGEPELAAERIEFALEIAESQRIPEVISQALNTKGVIRGNRPEENLALLERALKVALEHDIPTAALRAYGNLSDRAWQRHRIGEGLAYARDGLALARRRGDRYWETSLLAQMCHPLCLAGEWDEALGNADEITRAGLLEAGTVAATNLVAPTVRIHVNRGAFAAAQDLLSALESMASSADVLDRAIHMLARAILRRAQGESGEALSSAREAMVAREIAGSTHYAEEALVEAVEAALDLGDIATAEDLLAETERLPPFEQTQHLHAHVSRLSARLAALRGDMERADDGFSAAVASFRELAMPFWLGVSLVEQGEWLQSQGRGDDAEPLVSEAREIFERLGAAPWLERLETATVAKVPA